MAARLARTGGYAASVPAHEDEPAVPMSAANAAIVRRNLRWIRPAVVLLLVAIALALYYADGVPVVVIVVYLALTIPLALWYLTRGVNRMIAGREP